MDKTDFLSQLGKNLANLPKDEIENALNYYEEYFNDAGKENEKYVIKELGSPSKIASQVIATYAINDINSSPKTIKNGLSNVVLAFKALFASSIVLPIAILIALGVFGLILSMGILIISLFVGCIMSIVIGIGIIISSINWGFIYISLMINYFGVGIALIGLGMCIFPVFLYVSKHGFGLIAKFISKILLRRDKK